MRSIARAAVYANRAVIFLGAAAMAVLPLMIFYDVMARYFFRAPTIWASELSTYALQLIVFLPMGLLVAENRHISVHLVTQTLPPRAGNLLHRVSMVAICVFAAFLAWWGGAFALHAWTRAQVSPTLLAVPLWIPHALIPLGGLLLFLSALGRLLDPTARPDDGGGMPVDGTEGA